MNGELNSALNAINPSDLDYQAWVQVGMALKSEGCDVSVWDEWSRSDPRYHPNDCTSRWNSFTGSGITGNTIFKMARDNGWKPPIASGREIGWDELIDDDYLDFETYALPDDWNPVEDLKQYLKLLFKDEDHVGYVTGDVMERDGKWTPSGKGTYSRTAGELLRELEAHPNDITDTIGSFKPDAGAWIRFNPLDGEGVKNDNVTDYRFALVESDTMPIAEQDAVYRKLELPIAALVHSGNKSLHAIVRIEANDYTEYRKRVDFLYDYLEKNGVTIDKQNRNPSRLSRMPGVTRNGVKQRLIATNIGKRSWSEWKAYVDGDETELPEEEETTFEELYNPPEPAPELIAGILRCGHKCLITGPSKAGKSFLLMELAACITGGKEWLGHKCMKGNVLYVNLEIDKRSFKIRLANIFNKLYSTKEMSELDPKMLVQWHLRGKSTTLDKLLPSLLVKLRKRKYIAVIIDPIYKVITGDENSASEMAYFCNQFDKICAESGAAAIYVHHHSKGAQGQKKAADRSSGSGVFARDPDAIIDMSPIQLTPDLEAELADDGATAWRIEYTLREFKSPKPQSVWYRHPLHTTEGAEALERLGVEGSDIAKLATSGTWSSDETKLTKLGHAFALAGKCGDTDSEGWVKMPLLWTKYHVATDKTVKSWIDKFPAYYEINPYNNSLVRQIKIPDTGF